MKCPVLRRGISLEGIMPKHENLKLIDNSGIYTIKLQFNDGRRFEATTCSETNQLEALAGAIALMEYIDQML